MSEAELFTELMSLIEVDPFALIGVSVSADEKRIAKRYRQIAKQLHPDALASGQSAGGMVQAIAAQVIARIVNPSYQKLKHENGRQESLATVRFKVRRLIRTEKLVPTFQSAQQLVEVADDGVDIFYEQSLTWLAGNQFQSLQELHTYSLEISQLNLIFLSRKLENLVIRPKRAGLMSAVVTPTAVVPAPTIAKPDNSSAPASDGAIAVSAEPEIDYARKHTDRAKTYLTQQNYGMAVQELREALKISPQNPEIHSMIGQAYYKQNMSGMAKTYFRQALKLKPGHKVALKYSKLLGMSTDDSIRPTPATSKAIPKKQWLGKLLNR